MRYLYTLLTIVLSWVMIIVLMTSIRPAQHFLLYIMGIINTLVLFTIGFKRI
jgi:hypothetical protein